MATKAFHLCFCIFLFLVALPLHSHANPSKPKAEKPSPFEFIKHLEGCHKGEKVEGLQQLKAYLEKFGYLNYNHSQNQNHANDNDFDDLLESAVKMYQLNYHLKATGTLDAKTVSNMISMKPRCGNADIINGTNWMQGGKKRPNQARNTFHTVSHYAFLPGSPKWLSNQLTYAFLPGTNSDAQSAVARAFEKWAAQTHFTFSRSQDLGSANLKIGFGRLGHGDGIQNAFDGPWETIAHAFPPTDGTFHYDADKSWSVGAEPNAIDYETVALHEIGHLLGLDHSSVREAIMYAEAPVGVTKGLHGDDIEGIKALYNIA